MQSKLRYRATSLIAFVSSVVAVSLFSCSLFGQLSPGTQIQTTIRPGVWLQYSTSTVAATAVGIYDSGDPADTMSRDTALALGIRPTTPTTGPNGSGNYYNQGTTAAENITSGGWLGSTLSGPEVNTPAPPANWPDAQVTGGNPSHVFVNATTLNRSSPVTSNGIQPWYLDYNTNPAVGGNPAVNGFSENHTGQSFVTAANPANDLAVMVDPINGTPLPFAYDNVSGTNNGRGVSGASNPLDSMTSSVTYMSQGNARIPSIATDADPGFTYNIELIPQEYSSTTLTPAAGSANVVAGLPVSRQIVIKVSAANAPTVNGLIANNTNGISPSYLPAIVNAMGQTTGLPPVTSFTYNVQNANIAIGGTENPNGFVQASGSVQVVVQNATTGANVPNFNGGNPLTITLPTQSADPFAVVSGTGLAATQFLFDTGAPNTSVPMATFNALPNTGAGNPRILPQLNLALIGGGNLTLNNVAVLGTAGTPIVGTNVTNQFGQVWNYAPVGAGVDAANPNRGSLTLTGPAANPAIQAMMGNGILFTVGSATAGMLGTGVNQLADYGNVPQLQPNGAPTDAGAMPGAEGTVYRTDLTGSNASYIDTSAAGLLPGEEITGLSLGADQIGPKAQLFFSVTTNSTGLAGSAVNQQSNLNQTGASIYTVPAGQPAPYGVAGGNSVLINHEVLGLGANVGPAANAGVQSDDQLRDFKLFTQLALPAVSLSNLDAPITAVGDTGTGVRPRIGQDVLGVTYDTYFTTDLRGPNIFKDTINNVFATGRRWVWSLRIRLTLCACIARRWGRE